MRALYFSRDYTPHDHRFLSAIAESEWEVSYLRLEQSGRILESRPLPESVRLIEWWGGDRPLGWLDWPRASFEVRRIIEKEQPDLVHAGPIQSTAFLTALVGFHPLLAMSWGSDLLRDAQTGLGRFLARWTLNRTDVFTCDCEAVRREAVRLGAPADQIFVFPWGVDLNHFQPDGDRSIRASLGWSKDELVLISTRSWEPLYGIRELVKAFIELANNHDHIRLLMLGDGSLKDELLSRFERGGVAGKVVMPGQIRFEALPDYYRAADLYVSASHSDGSSISLLEAMACGLPVLVSDIPGNKEWVEPGKNGWWFGVGDSGELARALEQALGQIDTYSALGAEGRAIVEDRADWSKNVSILLDAYQTAVALGGSG